MKNMRRGFEASVSVFEAVVTSNLCFWLIISNEKYDKFFMSLC